MDVTSGAAAIFNPNKKILLKRNTCYGGCRASSMKEMFWDTINV